MRNRAVYGIGWTTVALSLIVAFLAAAPFTPAIFLVALLLPAAAMLACRGAVVVAFLSFSICLFAFAVSPLTWSMLVQWPLVTAWPGLCFVAVVLCSIHRLCSSSEDQAKLEDP